LSPKTILHPDSEFPIPVQYPPYCACPKRKAQYVVVCRLTKA